MPLYGEFSPDRDRTPEGWVKFPRDIERRKASFPDAVFNHPAKMNLFLIDDIIEHISKPGDWVLDPFGGTGSSMIAALKGRHVLLTEIEDDYIPLMVDGAVGLLKPAESFTDVYSSHSERRILSTLPEMGAIRIVHGDNRVRLPVAGLLVDAAITSPPYSQALKPSIDPLEVKGREGSRATYSASPMNLGNLNPYFWEDAMLRVWERCAQAMRVGAVMAVVNKDVMKAKGRELLSTALIRQAGPAGLKLVEWRKWAPPSTIRQETNRNKGGRVIEDEDILFFEKVEL